MRGDCKVKVNFDQNLQSSVSEAEKFFTPPSTSKDLNAQPHQTVLPSHGWSLSYSGTFPLVFLSTTSSSFLSFLCREFLQPAGSPGPLLAMCTLARHRTLLILCSLILWRSLEQHSWLVLSVPSFFLFSFLFLFGTFSSLVIPKMAMTIGIIGLQAYFNEPIQADSRQR